MKFERKNLTVHFKSSVDMTAEEVKTQSVDLYLSSSVYLKPNVWSTYEKLYRVLYLQHALRVLKQDGHFVVLQTDAYSKGEVFNRSYHLHDLLKNHFTLVDIKIWKRMKANLFQPPFTNIFVYKRIGQPCGRNELNKGNGYFDGVWDFPQVKGGHLNAFPDGLCNRLIDALTNPTSLIVDPLAGTSNILAWAARRGRTAIGYEINPDMKPTLEENYNRIQELSHDGD